MSSQRSVQRKCPSQPPRRELNLLPRSLKRESAILAEATEKCCQSFRISVTTPVRLRYFAHGSVFIGFGSASANELTKSIGSGDEREVVPNATRQDDLSSGRLRLVRRIP